ncbi:MAG: hypothetical protein CMJ87_11905 [Planctomycetes bacterium]|jgi:hypothetical protein|nr:hypothetical protein [Planctomycetota bacterium]
MTSTLLQDPDLAEVLMDVVADQSSTLFRVPLSTVVDGMAGATISVSARAAGLTSAERHLLDVHRASLAEHLRLAAWMVFERRPETRDRLMLDWELPDAQTWTSAARAELNTEGVSCNGSEVDLLRQCVEHGLDSYTSALPLALAAQRLVDTCSTREVLALDTLFNGHHASAERMLRDILKIPRTDRQVYYALLNLGGVAASEDRYRTAATHYLEASIVKPGSGEAPAAAFINAVYAGCEELALVASAQMGGNEIGPTLSTLKRQLAGNRDDQAGSLVSEAQRVLKEIRPRVNNPVKELIDALH